MAEIAKGVIDIEINTGSAAQQLKLLQQQINAFNLSLSKGNKNQSLFSTDIAKELQLAASKTGMFTSEMVKLSTAASTLDKTLSKGKSTLGQFFSAKFNKDSAAAAEVMGLAAERASRLQTQFIATSAAAKGMQESLAIRPLAAFSSEVAVAGQKAEIMSAMFKQGTTQLINFGKNVQWAGRQLMVGFTVPLTIFGNTAGKTFMDLEKQIVSFKKVYGDLFTTPAELNKNIEAVKGLAAEYTKYGIAAKDTISLAADAAAAGRQNKDLTDAVAQATRLATLGQIDQNSALETTIALQSAFKLSGQELADSINFLNMVENQTVVSLQDLSAAIPRVAPVIVGLGGDVKDLAVFLAAMQEGGVNAAEGANALKSGLASLINPTKQATNMLSGMGINLDAIIKANKGDLMGTVMAFSQALASLDQFSRQQALEQVFGKFQYAKLGALFDNISRSGSQAQQVIETMGYSTEQLAATADKELKTIEESFGVQLIAAIEKLKLAIAPIGEIFVKAAIPVVNFITDIVDKFNQLSEGKRQFIALAALLGGVVIPVVTMLSGLMLNFLGTFLKMGQSITAFTKALVTGGPLAAIKALTQGSKYLSLSEIDAAMAAQQLAGSSQALNVALVEQAAAAGVADAAMQKLLMSYERILAVQSAVGGAAQFAVGAAASKGIKTGGTGFIKRIKRNSGGTVPGSGNSDTVPAMLTPGEFVINKEATRNNLSLLKQINGGGVQSKNSGGMIQMFKYGGIAKKLSLALKYLSPKEILKGSYSGKEKELMQRALNIYGKNPSQIEQLTKAGSGVNPGYMNSSIANKILEIFGVKSTTNKSSRLVGNWGMFLPGGLNSALNKNAAKGTDLIKYSKDTKNLSSLEEFLSFNRVDTKTIEKVKKDVSDSIIKNINPNKLYGDPEFGGIAFLATQKQIALLEKQYPGIGLSFQKDRLTPGRRDTFRASSNGGGSGTAINPVGGRSSGYRSGKNGMVWAHWEDALFNENLRYLASTLKLNVGGAVPGVGNTDKVPAMLTPGEFVVNKQATRNNMGMLNAINSGGIQGFAEGGLVQGPDGKWRRPNGQFASAAEVAKLTAGPSKASRFGSGAARAGIGMAGWEIGSRIGGTPGGLVGSLVAERAFTSIAKAAGPLIKTLPMMTKVIGGTGIGAIATLGIAAYKLSKQVDEAKKAGGKMTEAMYGSAKSTEELAAFFGNQTITQASRIASVEKIAGRITPEAQQQALGFIDSAAGKTMKDQLAGVKSSGGNVVEALRNQLSAGIISGALTQEQANAVAVEMAAALGDQKIAVSVAGELSELLGPDGKDILKNLSTITAEITPKIDTAKIGQDATAAYDKLNFGQKFMAVFSGGKGGFEQNYKLEEISKANDAAYRNEAAALETLNLAYQDGTISLEEYTKQRKAITDNAANIKVNTAKALGFASTQDMVDAAKGTEVTVSSSSTGGEQVTTTVYNEKQLAAKNAIGQERDAVQQMLKDAGVIDEVANSIMEDADKIGGSIYGKLLGGEVDPANLQIVASWRGDLSEADLEKALNNMEIMQSIPNIETQFNFMSVNAEKDMDSIIAKAKEIEKNPQIVKDFLANDKFSGIANQFGLTYDMLASLDPIEVSVIMRNITTFETINTAAAGDPSERAKMLRDSGVIDQIKPVVKKATDNLANLGTDVADGGGGGTDWKSYINNRFDLIDKRLSKEVQQVQDLVNLKERQNDLDQRQVSINEHALKQLSKQEDEVNTRYDDRIKLLDDVATANQRLQDQESSRVNLARALAEGNVSNAAEIMSQITANEANYRIEDTRAALENQKQNDLKNLTVEINGQFLTREQIQENIDTIEERMYQRNLEVQGLQDKIYNIEQERLANTREREKVETRLFLIEQRKAIVALKGNKIGKSWTKQDAADLAEFKNAYNSTVDFFNATFGENLQRVMYGGKIKRFAMGSVVPGNGNTDRVPALLTPGEFVVRKSIAQANMPMLEALNNGSLSPKYNVPTSNFGIDSGSQVQQNTGIVYNDTYTINVNVAGTNASPDDIANVVMSKLSQTNRGSVRSIRY